MAAAYDNFDYPAYWIGRDYEHKSEIVALRYLLGKIKKIASILEVGAGFGRLVPFYAYRAKKVIVSDPSARNLKIARQSLGTKKSLRYLHISLENLPKKIKPGSIDLVIMIRVLHHINNLDVAFKNIYKLLGTDGYVIFEFANKTHIKSRFKHFVKGDFRYFKDKTTTDIRSLKAIKKGSLPFLNYHPEKIHTILNDFGFRVVDQLSVSNIRSPQVKKIFSTEMLLFFEKLLQKPLSFIDFGPSIFILAKKR